VARTGPRVLSVLALACLGGIAAHLALSTRYVVYAPVVVGNQRLTAEAVRAAAGIDGRRLIFIDRQEVAARVAAMPEIRAVQVAARMPNQVWITVEETRPVVAWTSAASALPGSPVAPLVLDERGRAMEGGDPGGLPGIIDQAGLIKAPGDRVPPDVLAAALGYTRYFGGLSYHAAEGFVSAAPGGWEILLGSDAGKAARQRELLAEITEHLQPIGDAVAMVDLRFERPYYRLYSR
jgi:hypothetical protein